MDGVERGIEDEERHQQDERKRHQKRDGRFTPHGRAEREAPAAARGHRRSLQRRLDHPHAPVGPCVPGAAQHLKGVHARLRGLWWCAADTDLGFTRDRRLLCASRVNPTCVDRPGLRRSRISGAPLHFVSRCAASGTRGSSPISGSGRPHPAKEPAAARGGAAIRRVGGAQHRERLQVRMKPSTSVSAQASVFSSGSPCMKRTTILVWIAWL